MKFASSLVLALGFAAQSMAFAPANAPKLSTALNAGVLTKNTGKSSLDPAVIDKYNALPFPEDKILAEYVWVDAVGNTRSKTRTLPASKAESVESLPKWNFDGSSTDQAPGDDSEVILRPCSIFKDPFRPRSDGIDNILVMCDTYTPAGEPLESNHRAVAEKAFEGKDEEEIWFGMELEFTLTRCGHPSSLQYLQGPLPPSL
mmetsp:Transcript_38804/g.93804  ORF Transcript_38804/g.93804 Transcript_38804/m.93804 type:complete len:202 (-) Transcript_38804:938-1543(-)